MPKNLLKKIKLSLSLTIVLFFASLAFFIGKTYADEAAPIPQARLPCDPNQTENPEFNSLRPYQAAPCGDYQSAFFCGNQINIVESKTERRRGEYSSLPTNWHVDKDYYIDLSEVSLPILGNTELVQNSQNSTDQIDDATKMNEYVSWYLNGVNNRAEYGDQKTTNDEVVNYSGPIQKLLPGAIADGLRVASIASASGQTTNTPDDDQQDIPPSGSQTHNQIVVCASHSPGLFGKFLDIFGLGQYNAKPCYEGNDSKASGEMRLTDWSEGILSIANLIGNSVVSGAVNGIKLIYPFVPGSLIEESLGNHWNSRMPPLPWEVDPYAWPPRQMTNLEYQKYYNEWRGRTCVIIPIFNHLICFNNVLVPNKYSDLFQYVPLASTPDKLGKMPIFTTLIQPSGANLVSSSWDKLAAPSLYYAHTQEVKDLSQSLNNTFVPKGVDTSQTPDSSETNDYYSNPACRVIDVRSNPGDNLFPIRTPGDVGVHVTFYVDRLDNCHIETKTDDYGNEITYTVCTGQVHIGIQTNPNKMPYIDNIWNTTVSGNASTFRRIYPKVEEGAPVSCIEDNPAVSRAVYKPVQGTDSIGVEGPLFSNDSQNMDPENAQIFFSHLGSVYDYFLKGIQTALRPKGYGDPTPQSGQLCSSIKQDGDCSWNMSKINQAIGAAASKYNVPSSLLNAIFQIESYEIINGDPRNYSCTPNTVGALGVTQITQQTYDDITCDYEKMSDIKMCSDYGQKLSRCNFGDEFELTARALLYKAGRFSACHTPTQGILESDVQTWYKAACNYYGSFAPDRLTVGLQNDIPQGSRRQDGDMNYCDIVGYKMGVFPPYPAR